MPKKISEWSKAQLVAVDLPMHGDSYTVISHQSVIDYVYTELAVAGFGVVSETFRATADGQIAHGIHVLQYQSDPELSMMFAWTNSYNKQVKFKCGVGAYVNQVGTFMVHGDMGSWARKHTGTADEETIETIKGQIKDAQMYYDQLKSDKDAMKEIKMNKRKQAQLLGILFAEYQILTTEQANIVRSEMIKPTHVFEDTSSLWAFYNYVTGALQTSHPKTWMEDQRVLHYFISSINNFAKPIPIQPEPVNDEEERVVDPLLTNYGQPENQTNLLVQIAEAEEASLELEPSMSNLDLSTTNLDIELDDSDVEEVLNEAVEETVTYTDLVGNTFEAPIIDVVNLNKETLMSVIISPCAAHDAESEFMDGIDESIDPIVVSLQPTPEDHIQFEKEQLETEDDFAFDFSDEEDDEEVFF
jgi:hypothetical protein